MDTTHKGRIALDEGGELDVDLHLSSTKLFIDSGSAEIGSWPLHKCLIEEGASGSFTLVVDEDMVDFTPDEPTVFRAAVDQFFSDTPKPGRLSSLSERLNGGAGVADESDLALMSEALDEVPLAPAPPPEEEPVPELKPVRLSATDLDDDEVWVSEDILESQRALRSATSVKKLTPELVKKVAIAAGVVVIVALAAWQTPRVLASVDLGSLFASEPTPATTAESTTTTTSTTVQSTTTTATTDDGPTETTVAEDPAGAFSFSSNAFVDAWNEIGGSVSPALRFPAYLAAGDFQQEFSSYLRMAGAVSGSGALESFTLTVDPTGPSNSDVLGINALGVAVAVVEPDLDGAGRKAVLASLGLNVEKPRLEGIDREVTRSGLVYELLYDADAVLLHLTVSPAG